MNFEKNIQWSKSFEKKQSKEFLEKKKEQLDFILKEEIQKIEEENSTIGQGKTGKICELKGIEDHCLKIISNKKASINDVCEEMRLLDNLFLSKIAVPAPTCSVKTEKNNYLFMDKIQGFSLKELLEKDLANKLPEKFNFKMFFKKLRENISQMHDRKIYHRDLYMNNIMINNVGDPVIIDFGDAIELVLSDDDPYHIINNRGEKDTLPDDENLIKKHYLNVGSYLENKKLQNKN